MWMPSQDFLTANHWVTLLHCQTYNLVPKPWKPCCQLLKCIFASIGIPGLVQHCCSSFTVTVPHPNQGLINGIKAYLIIEGLFEDNYLYRSIYQYDRDHTKNSLVRCLLLKLTLIQKLTKPQQFNIHMYEVQTNILSI